MPPTGMKTIWASGKTPRDTALPKCKYWQRSGIRAQPARGRPLAKRALPSATAVSALLGAPAQAWVNHGRTRAASHARPGRPTHSVWAVPARLLHSGMTVQTGVQAVPPCLIARRRTAWVVDLGSSGYAAWRVARFRHPGDSEEALQPKSSGTARASGKRQRQAFYKALSAAAALNAAQNSPTCTATSPGYAGSIEPAHGPLGAAGAAALADPWLQLRDHHQAQE